MPTILKEVVFSLVFPIILSIVAYYLERNKSRNKYEEMYIKLFAPIEKVKFENPNITKTNYIAKIEKIIFNNEVYSLVPPKFYNKFNEFTTNIIDESEFDTIVDNNTNELRKLIGIPHEFRGKYSSNNVYVKRSNGFLYKLILVMVLLFSISFPISMMYPSTYDKIVEVSTIAEKFILLYLYAVAILGSMSFIGVMISKAIDEMISSARIKDIFRISFKTVIKTIGIIIILVVILGLLNSIITKHYQIDISSEQQQNSTAYIEP